MDRAVDKMPYHKYDLVTCAFCKEENRGSDEY